jgi:arylsulfatase A-like enzyme
MAVLVPGLLLIGAATPSNEQTGLARGGDPTTLVGHSASQPVAGARPNLLIIISDNQHDGSVEGFMPRTWARIFEEGTRFTDGFATTPNCCPSRASILTGMYAHNHGVRDNEDPLTRPTVIQHLHDAGYFTGQVGKYLNSWDGSRRPEFDFWVAIPFGGSPYFNPRLNVNGTWGIRQGYLTHLLRDHALDFLQRAGQRNQPFVLLFAPTAPHEAVRARVFGEPEPAPGDESLYPDLPPYRPPNFNEEDVSDKPMWVQRNPLLTAERIAEVDAFRRKQLQTLNALDQAVDTILDLLALQGKLDQTFVLYLSDNGVTWGEHRLVAAARTYDGAIHVPFAVRYPPLAPAGRVESRPVANIDIAATMYELAGLAVPPEVDGRSLVPLLRGEGSWREDLLIEGWGGPPYAGIRTTRYYYIETQGDRPELYDLENDPYLLENRATHPDYAPIVAEMRDRLSILREPR